MAEYFIYNHGGSANHGCEALVRTALELFGPGVTVYSEVPQQDLHYGIQRITTVEAATTAYSRLSGGFLKAYLALKVKKDYMQMDCLPYQKTIHRMPREAVELSVGGDIYCYEDYRKFIRLHKAITRKGCKSVLLGCSLSESLFDDPEFIEDMKHYTYISARESLTYGMLQKAGFQNIGLAPDAAFTLDTQKLPLPVGFREGNTIGINISPLVVGKEAKKGIVLESFAALIRYILAHTDCAVALIPHVVWSDNDDREILKELYQTVNCPERVVMMEDCNCMQLKGFISRCRFFIGARTHATIAAYSTCVPTLVLGYSVKSRGIAVDLFDTDDHYVLPIQKLCHPDNLLGAFDWLWQHEGEIRKTLSQVMPGYVRRAGTIKDTVEQALGYR